METDSPSRALATPSAGTAFIFCQNKCTGEYFHLLSSTLRHCRMFWFCCSLCLPSPLSSLLLSSHVVDYKTCTENIILGHKKGFSIEPWANWECSPALRMTGTPRECVLWRPSPEPWSDTRTLRCQLGPDLPPILLWVYDYYGPPISLGNIHNIFIQPVQETSS